MTEVFFQLQKGYISEQLKCVCVCVSKTRDKEKYNVGHKKWIDSQKVSVDRALFEAELSCRKH